jgi:thioredoxin 1
MPHKKTSLLVTGLFLAVILLTFGCSKSGAEERDGGSETAKSVKVTFIELGSVNCVPCRMMQPVMDKLEENFPEDVEVVFYDVWTKEQEQYAREYGIRAIPTQVFLDANGEEFFRHEGFFPYEQVVEVLERKGVKN